jgi:hypothetical protein
LCSRLGPRLCSPCAPTLCSRVGPLGFRFRLCFRSHKPVAISRIRAVVMQRVVYSAAVWIQAGILIQTHMLFFAPVLFAIVLQSKSGHKHRLGDLLQQLESETFAEDAQLQRTVQRIAAAGAVLAAAPSRKRQQNVRHHCSDLVHPAQSRRFSCISSVE